MKKTTISNDNYVYYHLNEDKEIVYIGRGTLERCLSVSKRTEEHASFMRKALEEVGLKFVGLFQNGLSRADAVALETKLIKKFRPKYNKACLEPGYAGSGPDNHNARYSATQVKHLRDLWMNFQGSMREFHRQYMPDVGWASARKLLRHESYKGTI